MAVRALHRLARDRLWRSQCSPVRGLRVVTKGKSRLRPVFNPLASAPLRRLTETKLGSLPSRSRALPDGGGDLRDHGKPAQRGLQRRPSVGLPAVPRAVPVSVPARLLPHLLRPLSTRPDP